MENKEQEPKTPALEINPSESYRPRPVWQRIAAFLFIALIVAGTVACAFWKYLG
ncbi:MAG: hypothetical protein IJ206_12465 [Oscillospiraceae bacterium]|nr:hypothetical protein [Oscillospiraceae bacterium]